MIYNAVPILASRPMFVCVDVCVYVCVCVFVCACSTLQHTATRYYGTALFNTATYCCSVLQCFLKCILHCKYIAVYFTLQHTALFNTILHSECVVDRRIESHGIGDEIYHHCNTLQHTATHCNTLQHTATHCNTLRHTATHCNTLRHTATHSNTCNNMCVT